MREHHRSDDAHEIERELEGKRAKLDKTIDQIQERFSPGQLLDEGLRYFQDGPNDYLATVGSNLGKSVRDNPLPVAMIGLGVAWLAFGQGPAAQPDYRPSSRGARPANRSSASNGSTTLADRARSAASRVQRNAEEAEDAFEQRRQQAMGTALGVLDQVGETAADFRQRVAKAMEAASERWDELKDDVGSRGAELWDRAADGMAQARDTAAHASDKVQDTASYASDKALEIFERQPILAAAAGITLGAVLGSLFPASRQESEALAPYGEAVRRRAGQVGSEVADVAKDAGRAAADAAKSAGRAAADAALGAADHALDDMEQSLEKGSPAQDERLARHEPAPANQPEPPRPAY